MTTAAEFTSTLRPEDPAEMPRLDSLCSFWLCPEGNLYDAYRHYDFAAKLGEDIESLLAKRWVRVNVSRMDREILIQGRPNANQRHTLDDLRFSQCLAVRSDDGILLMEKPEEWSDVLAI